MTVVMSLLHSAIVMFCAAAVVMPPVVADAWSGVSTQFAGAVVASSGAPGRHSLNGSCSFTGAPTPDNRLSVSFGGSLTASGPQVPLLTYVRCDILNDLQSAAAEAAQSGSTAATLARADNWPVRPITVCISGFAVYGPTPVSIIVVERFCDKEPPPPAPVHVHSAVVGYITMRYQAATSTAPTVTLSGALDNSTLWSCSWPVYSAGAPFTVTCVPRPGVVSSWSCDVLHADASTTSATGRARATMDCDGGGVPEAQTAVVGGIGGHDSQWAQAAVPVSQFSCMVDGGALPHAPDFVVGCGDPGAIRPE